MVTAQNSRTKVQNETSRTDPGRRNTAGFQGSVLRPAERCAKCGACTVVCPIYQVNGREASAGRGKIHLLERLDPAAASERYAEILSLCLLCGACAAVCPRHIDVPDRIIRARQELSRPAGSHTFLRRLSRNILAHPHILEGLKPLAALLDKLPPESGLRLRFGDLTSRSPKTRQPARKSGKSSSDSLGPTALPAAFYFTGCYAAHLQPEIAIATQSLCAKLGSPATLVPATQTCCGLAAASAGDLSQARNLAKKNITAFAGSELPILTSCASCFSHLARYPKLLADEPEWQERAKKFADRLREFSTHIETLLAAKPENPVSRHAKPCNLLYHDPCHLRFAAGITDPPRRLLARFPGISLRELPHGPQCCGQGGLFHLAHPDLAQNIRARLLNDCNSLEIDTVTTTCTGCLLHWRQGLRGGPSGARVEHLSIVVDEILP